MFEILPNPSLETVLIVGRAAMLIGAFWIFAMAFTRWRRADERDSQRLHAQLERAFAEMRSLHETVAVMSARIEAMGERVETDSRRAPVAVASAQRGYDLAMRMAKNGSAVEDMVSNCGITRHEAELLTRLHAAKAQPEVASWEAQRREQPHHAPAAVTPQQQQQPQSTGRKRGSLLSVVG